MSKLNNEIPVLQNATRKRPKIISRVDLRPFPSGGAETINRTIHQDRLREGSDSPERGHELRPLEQKHLQLLNQLAAARGVPRENIQRPRPRQGDSQREVEHLQTRRAGTHLVVDTALLPPDRVRLQAEEIVSDRRFQAERNENLPLHKTRMPHPNRSDPPRPNRAPHEDFQQLPGAVVPVEELEELRWVQTQGVVPGADRLLQVLRVPNGVREPRRFLGRQVQDETSEAARRRALAQSTSCLPVAVQVRV